MTTTCPSPIYRVSIDWKNRIYKLFDEFDDAVAFARSLMETDGTKYFLGEKTPGSGILQWEDTITNKKIYKTIGVANNYKIFQWQMEKRREEQAKKWDEMRALYGVGPYAKK
jgi:hypothetical protein